MRYTKNDIERLSTLTHDEIRTAYARSGEFIEHFDINELAFQDFYVEDHQLVAVYKATITSLGERQDATLFIALDKLGYLGYF